ncbi:DHS-like NAD/FAD-binding domain-containing protein [Schizophyllum amplum]|uniref:DHS-like NAD/FAD-binding domain-containing protein n=1 Tax=Schizophyllum amplum TaxID=97359 RepID=A0A550CMA1_9AGAR|nr:DHS-like NAD/FAD-binding domain-containing protein [Auriculariopsis ampla]
MTVTLRLEDAHTDGRTRRSLHELSRAVVKSSKIVVVTGAGISCSCGIPDFRSSDGLYALVKKQYPDVVLKGRDLFDASLFRDATSTAVFYTFISQLKQSIDKATPSPTHHFIKALNEKKKLLRSYTQNIDGLEERVGLLSSSSDSAKAAKGKSKIRTKDVRNVQLHGDIHRVRCMYCCAEQPCTPEYLSMFNDGIPPDCPECLKRLQARVARSARPLRVGSLRPAIVLYDEPHPLGDEIGTIQTSDVGRKPDCLIIMGTSLKVHGLKKLVKDFAKTVHASASTSKKLCKVIFVNRTPPGAEWTGIIDYHIEGDADSWVQMTTEEWKKAFPGDWQSQTTLVDSTMASPFRTVKSAVPTGVKGKRKDVRKPNGEGENIPPSVEDMVLSTPDAIRTWSKKAGVEDSPSVPRRMPAEPDAMVLSSPQYFNPPKPTLVAPLSPSKRQQRTSHYDLQSSPSKKRTGGKPRVLDDDDEAPFAVTRVPSPKDDPFLDSEDEDEGEIEQPLALLAKLTAAKPRAPAQDDGQLKTTRTTRSFTRTRSAKV